MSLYKNGPFRKELVNCIRCETGLSDSIVSDEELIEKTEGSFLFASIELSMSLRKFMGDFKNVIFKRHKRRVGGC